MSCAQKPPISSEILSSGKIKIFPGLSNDNCQKPLAYICTDKLMPPSYDGWFLTEKMSKPTQIIDLLGFEFLNIKNSKPIKIRDFLGIWNFLKKKCQNL